MEDRSNCYANVSDKECFALTKKECNGCKFYKPSENPVRDRAKIMAQCFAYSKK